MVIISGVPIFLNFYGYISARYVLSISAGQDHDVFYFDMVYTVYHSVRIFWAYNYLCYIDWFYCGTCMVIIDVSTPSGLFVLFPTGKSVIGALEFETYSHLLGHAL